MLEHDFPGRAASSDDELALAAKHSDTDALALLILKYQAVAAVLVKGYHVAGQEQEDFQQEALTGFIKALRTFDCSCGVPFRAYAILCMKRQVQSAIRTGLAGKQRPLRDYVSLDESAEFSLLEDNRTASPESIIIMDEEAKLRKQKIQSLLSAFEQEALYLYLSGHSYEEMSKRMKSTMKSVDNALQRVRRKLRSIKL